MSEEFPIPDSLKANASIHCAALVVAEDWIVGGGGLPQAAVPSDHFRNGTLTFVKSRDRFFGITCWHVVDHYRQEKTKTTRSLSLRTMVNGFNIVIDRFIQPQGQYGDPAIDIAIREISPKLIDSIGKIAIDIDNSKSIPVDLKHGFAVGFPETLKRKSNFSAQGHRIVMPQVEIVAELQRLPTSRFVLYSELEARPEYGDYSGMSGGPIFWTDPTDYGIMGIIYEGGVGDVLAEGRTVTVYGEIATPEIIRGWCDQVEHLTIK